MSKDKQKEAAIKNAEHQAQVQKMQEAKINEIINLVRDVLYPELQTQGRSVNEIKVLCESLAVTINQGVYFIMKEKTVSDLDLPGKLSDKFPEREAWLRVLELIKDVPMDTAIESLQWVGQKIEAVIKDENKNRPFNELDFKLGTADTPSGAEAEVSRDADQS